MIALVIQVHATKWVESHPAHLKSAKDTMMGMVHFAGSGEGEQLAYMRAVKSTGSRSRLVAETSLIVERRCWAGGSTSMGSGALIASAVWYTAHDMVRGSERLVRSAKCSRQGYGDKAPHSLRLGAQFARQLIPFGAAVHYKPASFKGKNAIHKFSPWTAREIFAGYHSGSELSGAYLEEALRSASAWLCVHLHRSREIVLPVGREFKFHATSEGFFMHMITQKTTVSVEDSGVSSSSSSYAALEQEATPAESGDVSD